MSGSILRTGDESARSSMYRLLGRIWLREIDRDFLSQLCSSPLREAFITAGGKLPADDSGAAVEPLAIDYCQLFIGPSNHLPPYQSVWQAGQFNGKPTDSMRKFIDGCGYDVTSLPRGVMLDHFGVQLGVMGHVLSKGAALKPHSAEATVARDVAIHFFHAHLRWAPPLLEAAAVRAGSDFYRSTISLTEDFLRSEVEQR